MRRAVMGIGLLLLTSCGQDKPEGQATAPGVDPNLRIGHVMVEVGHRLESAGRASEAEDWGMTAYQVQEILEMFNMDMTRAALPGDCDDSVSDQMYANLLEQLPELRTAAEEEDADAFRERFATATGSCNGCHAGCNVPFIRVPSRPGLEVPMIGEPPTAEPPEPPAEAPPAEAPPAEPEAAE